MTNEMYIGPTVRGVVKHGTTFSGGIPERLERLAAAKPFVRILIVPVPDIARAVKASNTEGTAEAVAYDRIESLTGAEVKKIMEGE